MLTSFLPNRCTAPAEADLLNLTGEGLGHWRIRRYRTAAAVRAAWPTAVRSDDFWLRQEVLAFLVEQPQGMETEAIVLEDSRDFSRILFSVQRFTFSPAGQVSEAVKGKTSTYDFRRKLLAPFSFRVLSLGQFLTSGNFASDALERLSPQVAASLITAVAEALLRADGCCSAYVIKDLYPLDHPVTEALRASGHHAMPADPVMQLTLRAHWCTMEDYLADLSSKYRVRYRRARSKMEGIYHRQLSHDEVEGYQRELYALYRDVSAGASFNVVNVTQAYFPWLAKVAQRGRPVRFDGYFSPEGELIGFTTAIPNGATLQAHFLGIAPGYKRSHHLYHNMLFDLLETAITGGFRYLDYGRTALEIKSSVGATAMTPAVMVSACAPWVNRMIPLFTRAVYAAPDWTARNPFRD